MEKPKQQKKQNGRSRSFTSGGGGLVSFLRSTFVPSPSSTRSNNNGRWSFNHRNAFSGPIVVSIVPPEARGRRRQPSSSGYRTPEPSSPKVSCIGQVKRSKSKKAAAKVNPACCKNGGACPLPPRPPAAAEAGRCRPKGSLVKRVLFRRSRSRSSSSSRSSNGRGIKGVVTTAAQAPAPPAPAGLGKMKRFASGRAAFQDFDWQEAERRVHDDDEEEEDEGFVAHSAPLVLGGGVVASEPKKEVNLWRRRTFAPPTPLQLP